ncbi:MAG: hypothetical protein FJX75_10490 [Armatimonadetes bacterium]|nr:hypothetical protein [Armatimonadota bacterium]
MTYDVLLAEERIRRAALSEERRRADVKTLLDVAERELHDGGVEALSLEGRYEHAYSAVRALAEAVMAAEGFRPCGGPGQHEVVFAFLRHVPTARWEGEAEYFDACRQRRHLVVYRRAQAVTETELEDLLAEGKRFLQAVRAWLVAHHAPLAPDGPA